MAQACLTVHSGRLVFLHGFYFCVLLSSVLRLQCGFVFIPTFICIISCYVILKIKFYFCDCCLFEFWKVWHCYPLESVALCPPKGISDLESGKKTSCAAWFVFQMALQHGKILLTVWCQRNLYCNPNAYKALLCLCVATWIAIST